MPDTELDLGEHNHTKMAYTFSKCRLMYLLDKQVPVEWAKLILITPLQINVYMQHTSNIHKMK